MSSRLFTFLGVTAGTLRVTSMKTIVGEPLPEVPYLEILDSGPYNGGGETIWFLNGIVSNERYVTRTEKTDLVAKQEPIGRPEATLTAVIPIRKSAAWWAMTQDERRSILEEQSRHIQVGLKYLPAIARRLHHCRDLSEKEPFDFITLFEFAPEHEADFNALLAELRATPEWKYVEREVDIRLTRR